MANSAALSPCQAPGCSERISSRDVHLALCPDHAATLPHFIRAACWYAWKTWMRSGSRECREVLDLHQLEAVIEIAVAEGRMTSDHGEVQLVEARAKVLGVNHA